jgi:hypothetical protein
MIIIPKVQTQYLIKEEETDGHSPLRFVCSNDAIYFCKYITSINHVEVNCLAYEIVAHYLLKELNIPTPDIALVEVAEGTLIKEKIKRNKRLKVNDICFGSKNLATASEVNDLQKCNSRKEFNSLLNPEDIIRIAMFDLWINNVDRGRFFNPGFNYNLLLNKAGSKQQIVAFDHAFIFGGINQIGIFNPKMPFETTNKLHETDYYKSVIRYFDYTKFVEIVDNFVLLLKTNHQDCINQVISQLEDIWKLTPDLAQKIQEYLSDEALIEKVRSTIISSKTPQ